MGLFKKWRERRKAKKLAKQKKSTTKDTGVKEDKYTAVDERKDLKQKIEEVKSEEKNNQDREDEKVEKLKIRNFSKPKVTNQEPDWPKDVDKANKNKKTTSKKNSTNKSASKQYSGKYEVYPESGHYKFRLKASNGELLAVSFRYSTDKGATSGIDTFKKNVEEGQFNVVTDKSGYSQYRLFNTSGARLITVGEVYDSVQSAKSAIESVKKFYKTDKIEVLDSIPKSEVREETIKFDSVKQTSTGKYEIINEKDLFFARLRASNSQILFVSQGYASKASVKNGIKTIQNAIKDKNFTIEKDKQNRYQFNLYSSNGQLILTGESYPVRSNCVSAAHSVLKFGLKASVIEL